MTDKLLKNQIIERLKGCEYWLQYAGNKLLEGEDISEEFIDLTYELFKEDMSLKKSEGERQVISFKEISVDPTKITQKLTLKEIKNAHNVNALAPNQSIRLDSGLTIIYGENGTGKSGYVRLLNKAFTSRGDKIILRNVFDTGSVGGPSCTFTFEADSRCYDLEYPTDKNSAEFSQFVVFDSKSASVHLEGGNKLNFTPHGFDLFESLLVLYRSLETKLKDEIMSNSPQNNFVHHFQHENTISNEIINLGARTNIKQLRELANYTEDDTKTLSDHEQSLQALQALNIATKIVEIQKLKNDLQAFISKLRAPINSLNNDAISSYKDLISGVLEAQQTTINEGVQCLKEYDISELGSETWRKFIKASNDYAQTIDSTRDEIVYPSSSDTCLFCLQSLNDKQKILINSYWNLLASEAEKRLNQRITDIENKIQELENLSIPAFNETTTLYNYIKNENSALADRWEKATQKLTENCNNIIANLRSKDWTLSVETVDVALDEFDLLKESLVKEIDELTLKNPSKEIADLEIKINYLRDKSPLNKLIEKILDFVKKHQWSTKAKGCLLELNTRSITIKQGELFNKHITERYTQLFDNECKSLRAPLMVNIIQKNVKGSTLRNLEIAGEGANRILSEGEQRAISLADFFTEIQLNPSNSGVIFDDPITSQDHKRREAIALRIAEFAKQKQVVVFTHDIAFFTYLKFNAERHGISHRYTTIRSSGGQPGIISPDLPWIVQPVKSRIGFLRNRLVQLKKTEKQGDETEYLFAVKSWYGLLREAWERAVEERLFKGVVERFRPGIETQRFRNLEINDEIINEIKNGMTDCSSWLHDAAQGLHPTPPDTEQAERDLATIDTFIKKCKAG